MSAPRVKRKASDVFQHAQKRSKHTRLTMLEAIQQGKLVHTSMRDQFPEGFNQNDEGVSEVNACYGAYQLISNENYPTTLIRVNQMKGIPTHANSVSESDLYEVINKQSGDVGNGEDKHATTTTTTAGRISISYGTLILALLMQHTQSPLFPHFKDFGIVRVMEHTDLDDETSPLEQIWYTYVEMEQVTGVDYNFFMESEKESNNLRQRCCAMWLQCCKDLEELHHAVSFENMMCNSVAAMVQNDHIQLTHTSRCRFQIADTWFLFGSDTDSYNTIPNSLVELFLEESHKKWFRHKAQGWIDRYVTLTLEQLKLELQYASDQHKPV